MKVLKDYSRRELEAVKEDLKSKLSEKDLNPAVIGFYKSYLAKVELTLAEKIGSKTK